jgi:hypothetical protein
MALTLTTTMRDAIANAVDATINAGGGAGYLEFQTAANAEVATITFETTAFGDSSTGVITMASAPKSDTSAAGSASAVTQFKIYDNGAPGELLITGSVGVDSSDINFAGGVTFGTGDTVTLTSLTITCPSGA